MADATTLRRIVAHLYVRSGRAMQSESELANALSLDLKWFPPKDARALVAGLARAGYLVHDDDGDLVPTFDVKAEPVPLGFRPAPDVPADLPPPGAAPAAPAPGHPPAPTVAKQAPTAPSRPDPPRPVAKQRPTVAEPVPETGLGVLLEALALDSGEEVQAWVARMDAVVQRTDDALTPEVALLLAAAGEGVDVAAWLAPVRKGLAPQTSAAPR